MAVDADRDGPVLVVTLNRPERLNALTAADYAALAEAWRRAAHDPGIHAVVLTGAGSRAFCTGADLYDTIPNPPRLRDIWQPMGETRADRGLPMPKPVVAAVRGYCLGGGLTLMLNTDLRVASTDATFSLPEVRWGIPVHSDPRRLATHAVGMAWMLTGDRFDAATALRHGLVNRVVPTDDVLPTALALARRVAEHPPAAVRATKDLAQRAARMSLADGDRLDTTYAALLAHRDPT